MLRIFIIVLSLFTSQKLFSQELNSKVIINTDKLQSSEVFIFEEMQSSIEQFLNNNIWTEDKFQSQERINCNFIINILNEPSSNLYEATRNAHLGSNNFMFIETRFKKTLDKIFI